MDRRQRLRRDRDRLDQRRVRLRPGECLAAVACIVLSFAAAAEIPLAERRSGYEFMGRETRAMQDDDVAEPGDAVGARRRGALESQGRRRRARVRRLPRRRRREHEGRRGALSGLRRGARTAGQSRAAHQHLPHRPAAGAAARVRGQGAARADRLRRAAIARGADRDRGRRANEAIPRRRPRQRSTGARASSISPAPSATTSAGATKLAGNPIPQAHPTGYPLYRLEWQGLGSLQRRLRNCFIGVRAEPYAYGAPEFVDLELYLMWRARGMKMESPAVRP